MTDDQSRWWIVMGIRCWRIAWTLFVGGVVAGLGGAGCSGGGRLDSAYAGRTLVYEPGVPNFDLVAAATLRDGRAGIDCYLGVPHASLVFLPRGARYEARFETLFRLLDERGKTLVAEYADADTVRLFSYDATRSFDPFLKQKRLDVEPGAYVLDVVVTDAQSSGQARRRQRVEVMGAGGGQPALSRIRLEGRRAGHPFEPILSLHLPAAFDSLRASVELYLASRLEPLQMTMRLMRFPSDTAAARLPYYYRVSPFYGLVRYDEPDTLQVSRRRLLDLDRAVEVAFDLPVLETGIYRIEVVAETPGGHPVLFRRRDVAVRSADFPRISTLGEMIEPLTYIADPDEFEHMRAAGTPAEGKQRFDAFWGSLVTTRQQAANLIKLYYSRVEEANLRYTTYKEGWKTDRGMVFILFGSPLYIDQSAEGEVWHYSYDERDAVRAFVFERRPLYQSEGMFEAYVLQRGMHLEPTWRRARDRWRRGEVL